MGELFELSYCDLRSKEIINTFDGSRLGRIVDIIFSAHTGEVRGIVVPYCRRVFFSRSQEIFIPWKCINKIGEDVILVCLVEEGFVGSPIKGGRKRRYKDAREYCPPTEHKKHEEHHHNEGCGFKGGHDEHWHDKDFGKGGHHGTHFSADFEFEPYGNGGRCDDDCDRQKEKRPNCDHKCEKCMLFDCEHRWKDSY